MVTESDILTLQGRVSNTGNIDIFNGCYSSTAADSPTTRTVVSYGTIDAAFATYYVDYLIELSQSFNEDITIVFKLAEADGARLSILAHLLLEKTLYCSVSLTRIILYQHLRVEKTQMTLLRLQ